MWLKRLSIVLLCMLLSSAAFGAGVPVDQATSEQKQQANDAYKEGRASYDKRQFVDALRSFRASYDIVASPNTHLLIAHTLRELGRNAEAYDEFGLVAVEAREAAKTDPKYEKSAELAIEEQKLLREKIGLVTVEVTGATDAATLTVEGRQIPREKWGAPIAVDPGRATFLLTTAGDPVVREREVTAGGEHTLRIDASSQGMPDDDDDDDGSGLGGDEPIDWFSTVRIISYGVAGAGVVSFALAGVFGGLSLGKHNELEEACGDLPCPERQDDIDSGRTFQTVSNVMLIVGGGLIVSGVVLWIVAPQIEGSGTVEGEADVEVGLRVGPTSLIVEGRF